MKKLAEQEIKVAGKKEKATDNLRGAVGKEKKVEGRLMTNKTSTPQNQIFLFILTVPLLPHGNLLL